MRRLTLLAAALLPGLALAPACGESDSGNGGRGTEGTADVGPGGGPILASGGGGSARGGGGAGAANAGGGGASTTGGGGGTGGATSDCNVLGEPGTCEPTDTCKATSMHAPWSGFCPGTPADIECCIPAGLLLCDPSVVALPNTGKTHEAPGGGGCPPGMVHVGAFCIDQYEASLVKMSDGSSWSPFVNPGATAMVAVSVKGAIPQAYIDQVQAGDACTNAGKRLCTDAEWLRACQGPGGTTYPYGDTRMPGVCNDHRDPHPAYEYFGTTDSSVFSMLDNPCIDQIPESLEAAGANAGCVSAEGAFDMMGNIHEWTSAAGGTFRGGFYVDTVLNGNGCLYATTAHDTAYWDYSTGFRCCAD